MRRKSFFLKKRHCKSQRYATTNSLCLSILQGLGRNSMGIGIQTTMNGNTLKPRLRDTTGCQTDWTTGCAVSCIQTFNRLSNRLFNCLCGLTTVIELNKHSTGYQAGWPTGLTTGCIVYKRGLRNNLLGTEDAKLEYLMETWAHGSTNCIPADLNTFYTIWRLVEPLVKLRYRVKGGLDAETVVVACSDGHVARSNYWFWYDALTTKVRTRLHEEATSLRTPVVRYS